VLFATGKTTEARGVLFEAHARFPRDPEITAELNVVDADWARANGKSGGAKKTTIGMIATVKVFFARA
jgi:hypothetical protein